MTFEESMVNMAIRILAITMLKKSENAEISIPKDEYNEIYEMLLRSHEELKYDFLLQYDPQRDSVVIGLVHHDTKVPFNDKPEMAQSLLDEAAQENLWIEANRLLPEYQEVVDIQNSVHPIEWDSKRKSENYGAFIDTRFGRIVFYAILRAEAEQAVIAFKAECAKRGITL